MKKTIAPSVRSGSVRIPASKSQAHRLLICAALGERSVSLRCDGISKDIAATVRCLNALGADIRETPDGCLHVTPIRRVPEGLCELPCGESGSTLRFLLPVAGVLGATAVFRREGRLPQRPLAPYDDLLTHNGMTLREDGADLYCSGRLRGGSYDVPGNISSQYVSGLMMALPRAPESSMLTVLGTLESAPYVAMTEAALALAGVRWKQGGPRRLIYPAQHYALPETLRVEGDWSNAAFFLCMGALSEHGVTLQGLSLDSAQGDRAVLDVLARFGAQIEAKADAVTVRRGTLTGCTIDARAIPDLIPVLSVVASVAAGETQVVHAARLRLKESDRLLTTARMLTALGGDVEEQAEGLVIRGVPALAGGTVDCANDHRIAMAAAAASCACTGAVTVSDAKCTEKSYPAFWDDFATLEEEGLWRSM